VGDACGRRMEGRLQAQLAAAEEAIRADMRRQLLQQRRALLQRLDAQRSAREHNTTVVSDPALTLGHAAAVALPAADAALDADRGAGAGASGACCTPHDGARHRLPERVPVPREVAGASRVLQEVEPWCVCSGARSYPYGSVWCQRTYANPRCVHGRHALTVLIAEC
jgi:hypothetical protein